MIRRHDIGRTFADDPSTLARSNADRIRGRTAVRSFCGDLDSLLPLNDRFHELLQELDIEHEYTIVPGAAHPYDEKIERLGLQHFGFFRQAFAGVAGR